MGFQHTRTYHILGRVVRYLFEHPRLGKNLLVHFSSRSSIRCSKTSSFEFFPQSNRWNLGSRQVFQTYSCLGCGKHTVHRVFVHTRDMKYVLLTAGTEKIDTVDPPMTWHKNGIKLDQRLVIRKIIAFIEKFRVHIRVLGNPPKVPVSNIQDLVFLPGSPPAFGSLRGSGITLIGVATYQQKNSSQWAVNRINSTLC